MISGSLDMFSNRSGVQRAGNSNNAGCFIFYFNELLMLDTAKLGKLKNWPSLESKMTHIYAINDVQVQFYMMSLYVLKTTDQKGYYTSFKVPDVYGVFPV